ncbi:LysR family transcriptional regulator [Pantoea coffeiphila]|uniref:LysR family transcriptional regulator n=1 Tax=Pantoea coffeiphila TaxID=1465635 RepID=A0A2S9I4Q5_9GAMM|nr:LysR family transcriptional regulator [Pantoea coffeiphila]PRD12694.1 LysR family transcriptional regulator [Pantoea coffeiphila]
MSNILQRLDLNLLVTLDALLTENNVTRAAARLHLSQPAVSVQLARLRDLLGDPLLLPGPRGMRPTARADELREPLRQALAALELAIAPSDAFDPAEATQRWRIAAFDYAALTLLVPALDAIRSAAPAIHLAIVQSVPSQVARAAERGDIDLAFMTGIEAPADLHYHRLFAERYVLAGRAGHPQLKTAPSLAEFCQLEHAIVSPDGGGFLGATDTVLAERGLARKVSLSVPSFLLLSAVLADTDLVAMAPSRLVCGNDALCVVEPPVDVPGFEMLMLWPERVHRDPAHRWLREQIAAAR